MACARRIGRLVPIYLLKPVCGDELCSRPRGLWPRGHASGVGRGSNRFRRVFGGNAQLGTLPTKGEQARVGTAEGLGWRGKARENEQSANQPDRPDSSVPPWSVGSPPG